MAQTAERVIQSLDAKVLWAAAIPTSVLGILLIVSGSVTIENDKDLSKPVVGLQAAMLVFGVLAVIAAMVLYFVAIAKYRKAKIGTIQFGGRSSWLR